MENTNKVKYTLTDMVQLLDVGKLMTKYDFQFLLGKLFYDGFI